MSNKTLHVGAPNIGDRELFDHLVNQIFDRRWFTNNGLVVQQLEEKLKEYLGVKHCFTVCNATVGLQLVCHALELTGQVIVPGYTFVATPHAAHWEGLDIVFADVDLQTHTICPESISAAITEKTSAILAVHVWGHPCEVEKIDDIAAKHGLKVIYDSAHAFGCQHKGQMIGNFGQCEVFSFHATKFFNTFEGGAITTNDDELAEKIRLMRNFGFAGVDDVVYLGTNAKMPEINAAMGLSVYANLNDILATNQRNYLSYKKRLSHIPGIRLFDYDHLEKINWQYIVLEIDSLSFGATRDQVCALLHESDIRARRYFYPGCHRMEPYRSINQHCSRELPNTEKLCDSVLVLPTGSTVNEADIEVVCDLIESVSFGASAK